MGRRDKDDEVESLRKEIRELKSINRQLMKQVKKFNKGYNKTREDTDDEPEEKEEVQKERCPNCSSTSITSTSLKLANGKSKTLRMCDSCGYKKSS